ncbi:tetratricopeptide repeat protein, partial [Nocardia tengchongensis]|uniref:tetratricopeptide repeat protein n=1 Tax=Nocardia tengchongensis TaxID=2055889 RepID=UPI0036853B89
ANRLSDLGRREDALAAVEEAVGYYRGLAAIHPDAFVPDLAMSLNNQANRLSGLGRREDALAAVEEAVRYYRELAGRHEFYLPLLAESLISHSIRLTDLRDFDAALMHDREAVLIFASLYPADVGRYREPLDRALKSYAIDLSDLGHSEEEIAAEIKKLVSPDSGTV